MKALVKFKSTIILQGEKNKLNKDTIVFTEANVPDIITALSSMPHTQTHPYTHTHSISYHFQLSFN